MTDAHETWQAIEVRRPQDVPTATPLLWLAEKHDAHISFERVNYEDALAVLALEVEIERAVRSRGSVLHQAMRLGATWAEAAAALDITPDAARALLRSYADAQHRVHADLEAEGKRPIGLDDDEHAATIGLLHLADNDRATITEQ